MRITRDQLLRALGNDPELIRAFERLLNNVGNIGDGVTTNFVQFNSTSQTPNPGLVWYDPAEGTICAGMNADGVTQQIGMESYYPLVINETGATITNGTLVSLDGVNGGLRVRPFIADGSIDSRKLAGVITHDLADGDSGYCTLFGYVRGVDGSGNPVGEAWNKGDFLYASPSVAGAFTNLVPTPPNLNIPVGIVIDNGPTSGVILVRILDQTKVSYGWFTSNVDQTLSAADTPTAVTFNTTEVASGVSVVSNSRVTVANSGLYTIQFRLQLACSSASTHQVYVWLRKNGTDITDSASNLTIQGASTRLIGAWNFEVLLDAGNYIELIYAADTTSVSLDAQAVQVAPYARPAIPSASLTIEQINN